MELAAADHLLLLVGLLSPRAAAGAPEADENAADAEDADVAAARRVYEAACARLEGLLHPVAPPQRLLVPDEAPVVEGGEVPPAAALLRVEAELPIEGSPFAGGSQADGDAPTPPPSPAHEPAPSDSPAPSPSGRADPWLFDDAPVRWLAGADPDATDVSSLFSAGGSLAGLLGDFEFESSPPRGAAAGRRLDHSPLLVAERSHRTAASGEARAKGSRDRLAFSAEDIRLIIGDRSRGGMEELVARFTQRKMDKTRKGKSELARLLVKFAPREARRLLAEARASEEGA